MSIPKLPNETVHEICRLLEEGCTGLYISRKLNVSIAVISTIRNGNNHIDISKHYNIPIVKRMTKKDVHKICKLIMDGKSNVYISKVMNISDSTVSSIRTKRIYKDIVADYNFPKIRISTELIHEICKLMEEGYTNAYISNKLDIHDTVLSSIRQGKSYRSISKNYKITKSNNKESIDNETVIKICELLEQGEKNAEISVRCNVSRETVSCIRNGITHRDISKNYNIERIYRNLKLKEEDIHDICRLLEEGFSVTEISKIKNTSRANIYRIKSTPRYSYIRKDYNFDKNNVN